MKTYRDLYPNRDRWANPLWFDACADLSEGATDDQPQGCRTTNNNNVYICTRPANHEGPHVADDGDIVLDVWSQ